MARIDRVRGYTIPGRGLASYLVGIFPQWGPDVIDDSIFLVRPWGDAQQYVIFNTFAPIQIAGFAGGWYRTADGEWVLEGANIGREIDGVYKGFALTIDEAESLGLYEPAIAQSIEPDRETLRDERAAKNRHRDYANREKEKDTWRNEKALANDLASGLGGFSAGVVNFTGRVLGKTVAGFVGSLGPYGVLALTVAAGAATAYYVVPLVKAAKRG